ncbi:FprA family A-type flavoprotein [bacterium]|nr:FprA family A-type flavoprotein [bacterium]
MKSREINDRIAWFGTIDWDRRLFDSLIPLPDGTSYNAYLVRGSEKTVLIDTTDPPFSHEFLKQLKDVSRLDYVISHHAEQDHSGSLPHVLEKYPDAKLLCSTKAKPMLLDLLGINEERFKTVEDGEELSLGDMTLKFIYTPWVHWPETMVTYLKEEKILFSCDFFGSHIASSELYVTDEGRVYEAAKRYFAEIMMPFRTIIQKNLEKLAPYKIEMIAPSHGPIYKNPEFIISAYREWVSDTPKNMVVIPYVSMHESTRQMVSYLVSALIERGIGVQQFDVPGSDIGKIAMSLVDAATVVVATPTVLAGPHPAAAYATFLANALKPKTKYLAIIGSFGWGGKTVEILSNMIPNLKVEVLGTVLAKGLATEADYKALDELADKIAAKHKGL